jgi:DNA-binding MurR/RpiR family transcriptional regulator
MPFSKIDLINKIEQMMDSFSKRQKQIAAYLIKHYEKAAYMTAAQLGKTVGVSESTVVRFAYELGYDGFPELKKSLQEVVLKKINSIQRLEIAVDRISEQNVLKHVIASDINNLTKTLSEIKIDEFDRIVNTIIAAKRIFIIGVRSSAALANFMSVYFSILFDTVILINAASVIEIFEKLSKINENDVVIGLGFPRYSKRTVNAMQFAKLQNCKTIVITDNADSPLVEFADYFLTARSNMASFVDSLVAPLSVINALIVAIGMKKKEEVFETFKKLETLWEQYEVYENYTLNQEKNKEEE